LLRAAKMLTLEVQRASNMHRTRCIERTRVDFIKSTDGGMTWN